jgi:hypothetical protein
MIAKLVSAPIKSTEHGDALLEVAFLVSAVDGHLADEELAAFKELIEAVRGTTASKRDVGELLERFVLSAHTVGVDDRLRTVAKVIPNELRETTFKVAVALSLVDHDESAHEDELVGILGAALSLAERAIPLAAEARAAVGLH